jgi:thiol-disulfide isomerase/thioredoxin
MLCACGGDGGESRDATLAGTSGHWVIVNYWAEWCKPCIKEIPELNHLARDHPEIRVLGVNFDGATGEDLDRQVAALGIDFPVLLLPTTLVLNPAGEVAATLVGPQTLDSLLAASLLSEEETPGE